MYFLWRLRSFNVCSKHTVLCCGEGARHRGQQAGEEGRRCGGTRGGGRKGLGNPSHPLYEERGSEALPPQVQNGAVQTLLCTDSRQTAQQCLNTRTHSDTHKGPSRCLFIYLLYLLILLHMQTLLQPIVSLVLCLVVDVVLLLRHFEFPPWGINKDLFYSLTLAKARQE